MKITEDLRKYATEKAVSEEKALAKGMEEPSAAESKVEGVRGKRRASSTVRRCLRWKRSGNERGHSKNKILTSSSKNETVIANGAERSDPLIHRV